MARMIVEAASDRQASDIVLMDTRQACSFADYFVICNGETGRQIEAIGKAIDDVLKKEGIIPHHREGTADSGWVLFDLGGVIVHIFAPFEREYYQLEKMWSKAQLLLRIM
jgi:ribosome-associated protein